MKEVAMVTDQGRSLCPHCFKKQTEPEAGSLYEEDDGATLVFASKRGRHPVRNRPEVRCDTCGDLLFPTSPHGYMHHRYMRLRRRGVV